MADGQFGLRMSFVDIASARLYPAVLFEIFHCQNDSVNKNPAPVGAAIGRLSVNIRSDEKKSASAVKTISDISGRAPARSGRAMLAPTKGYPFFLQPHLERECSKDFCHCHRSGTGK
ncbi:MAG: hypothetical protein ACI3VE_00005, partial [Oscillospiraceae bacterium]